MRFASPLSGCSRGRKVERPAACRPRLHAAMKRGLRLFVPRRWATFCMSLCLDYEMRFRVGIPPSVIEWCVLRRLMPVAIQRGGVIPGMTVLIVAAAGAWSLFGACPACCGRG